MRRNGQCQTPSSRVRILVQANTTLWLYGIMFALAVTKNMIQTNTGALRPSNPYMMTKVPSVPVISCPNSQGALSCSCDSYKLIYFSEKHTTSATHHPSPQECPSNTLRHPPLHLISAAQFWFIALITFTAVPLLSSLSQPLILPQSHPRL